MWSLGLTGGTVKNPTYSGNHKGHYEAVEITYDQEKNRFIR
jgi:peptide-methionine (S)-S-oxide reductase